MTGGLYAPPRFTSCDLPGCHPASVGRCQVMSTRTAVILPSASRWTLTGNRPSPPGPRDHLQRGRGDQATTRARGGIAETAAPAAEAMTAIKP